MGLSLFALAGLSILIGMGAVLTGGARDERLHSPIWLLAGPPELLCLLAAAILGKEKYQKLSKRVRRSSKPSTPAFQTSRLRYYLGLAGCLFNAVPLVLYAYVPELLPGGSTKMSILVIADLVFIVSLFSSGGEFWDKLRRIFVFEGDRYRAG